MPLCGSYTEAYNSDETESYQGSKEFLAAATISPGNNRHDEAEYFALLHKAASFGHPDARVSISFARLLGNATTVPRDISAAVSDLLLLAEEGNPSAQQAMAFCYANGIGVDSDQAKALVYLTFAALGGDTYSQLSLGYRYHVGNGVARSCETSLSFYREAADRVNAEIGLTGGVVVERTRLDDDVRSSFKSWWT